MFLHCDLSWNRFLFTFHFIVFIMCESLGAIHNQYKFISARIVIYCQSNLFCVSFILLQQSYFPMSDLYLWLVSYMCQYSLLYFDILYTGKYLPSFYFRPFCSCCQQANLRLGEFQCFKLFLLRHTVSGRIQGGAKLFACVKGQKLNGGENNPVYSIVFILTVAKQKNKHDCFDIFNTFSERKNFLSKAADLSGFIATMQCKVLKKRLKYKICVPRN